MHRAQATCGRGIELTGGTNGAACTLYCDGLILDSIISFLDTVEAASFAAVCRASASACYVSARVLLEDLLRRLGLGTRYQPDSKSPIIHLHRWQLLEGSLQLWLRPEYEDISIERREGRELVSWCRDRSGRGNAATSSKRMPVFAPNVLNGHGIFEFNGSSMLRTKPFATPLQQPITMMIVASARGDTTMMDSLGSRSTRVELCHGYPVPGPQQGGSPPPQVCMTACGQGSQAPSRMLRGNTRSTGGWHLYTAVFDGERSALYVDGKCEAQGTDVGPGTLDGVTIGCDHNSTFFLQGGIAEIRLWGALLPHAARHHAERAIALRYGLTVSSDDDLEPARSKVAARLLSCFTIV